MSIYNGTKCISCGQTFKDNDDIVVCPVCGTPYHRECYQKEGKCINTSLHENNESWKPEYERSGKEQESTEPIRCIRCGAENPPEGIFCNKCGMPLSENRDSARPFNTYGPNVGNANNNGYFGGQQGGYNRQQDGFSFNGQSVFFDKDSEIEGVKLDDYSRYTGKNSVGFIPNFIRFGKFGGKFSLNLGALIFPEFYFFYRKMYKLGALFLTLIILLGIPSMIVIGQSGIMDMTILNTGINISSRNFNMLYSLCSYLAMGVRFLCGFFATYWYYRTARKNILQIRSQNGDNLDETRIKEKITAKGGVSLKAVIVAVTIYCVFTLLSYYLINIISM